MNSIFEHQYEIPLHANETAESGDQTFDMQRMQLLYILQKDVQIKCLLLHTHTHTQGFSHVKLVKVLNPVVLT